MENFIQMLPIGSKAQDFKLKDKEGNDFQFGDLLGKKTIVLYFYPKNETPACTKEACAFRDAYEDFLEKGAEVVGISSDSVGSHLKFASNRRLPFILLSDPDLEVHKLYGVSSSFFGLFRERITYVIDKEGIVRHAFKSQINIGKHVADSLEMVAALA